MKIKKFNESLSNVTKTQKETLTYYNLFELLNVIKTGRQPFHVEKNNSIFKRIGNYNSDFIILIKQR
jgi:hypothetical protein